MDQQLIACQKEIRRLRNLVGHYGNFFDEVKKVCDSPTKTAEQIKEAIEKLIIEYEFSINNIENIIRCGLSFKDAVIKEIETYIEKDLLPQRIFLSNCHFYENIKL